MTQRAVLVDKQHAEALTQAAQLLAVLAAVERSHSLGDYDDMDYLFGALDPIDVRMCASAMQTLYELWRLAPDFRAGTTGEPPDGDEACSHPASSRLVSADGPPHEPTGPEQFSVKVPPPCD